MWDANVPGIGLAMALDSLEQIPEYPLLEGYDWRFYQPGDGEHWARIEESAEAYDGLADARNRFCMEFPDEAPLAERMIFLTHNGLPCATATAWFEPDGRGHLHYVSVEECHQGRGLSRPLVSLALRRMRELGHTRAYLTTQTQSWLAIRIYAEFGFRPAPWSERDGEGWAIVSQKTGKAFEL